MANTEEVLEKLISPLEEARFWTTIIKEHALFIKLGLPCDRTDLIREAESYFILFERLEIRVNRATVLTPELRRDLIQAVQEIIMYKRQLMAMMVQCQLPAAIFPLLLDHLTREALHFLMFLETPAIGDPERPLFQVLEIEVFWLRIMKEHVEFVIHLLDPSERSLLSQAEDFKESFVDLLQTANDLQSMAYSDPQFFNTVVRFTDEVIAKTTELREFKAAAYELLLLCQILSIIPSPLLADHLRREADKFLTELLELRPALSAATAE